MTVAIGMFQTKDERNIGSLLRSAHLYDVDFTFQIGGVSYRHAPTDTSKSPIPHYRLESFEYLEDDMQLVAVEMDTHSVPLSRFSHPESVAYLLGSENRGIPRDVLDQIGRIVQVETKNPWSLNVATAGAIVLHHRYTTINEGIQAA